MDIYSNGDRKYTTYKKREKVVCRVIDYIFYRSKILKQLTTIDAPALDTLPEIGLPSKEYPSDHVLIGTVFGYY